MAAHAAGATGAKPPGYYDQARAELVARLPRPLGRVLDVGCGGGGAAGPLREGGAAWLAGIELDADAAARARSRYDQLLVGRVEDVLGDLDGRFDTILLYDVLEHLPDPEALLARLHEVAATGAHVHVSVPNARHWSLVRDLVLRGTFGYTEAGHRDRTHLRWFTRSDVVALLDGSGWEPLGTGHGDLRPVSRVLARVTGGRSAELLVYQLQALARARGSAPAAGPTPVA